MNKDYITLIIIIIDIVKIDLAETNEIPIYIIKNNHPTASYPLLNLNLSKKPLCLVHNKFIECTPKNDKKLKHNSKSFDLVKEEAVLHNINRINSFVTNVQPILQRILMTRPATTMSMSPRMHANNMMYPIQGPSYTSPNIAPVSKLNMLLNNNPFNVRKIHTQTSSGFTSMFSSMTSFTHNVVLKPTNTVHIIGKEPRYPYQNRPSYEKFTRSLDQFERKFYMVTFKKLTSISPQNRRVNGMSFVQSGFFLQLTLMALSLEVDSQTRAEIDNTIGFRASDTGANEQTGYLMVNDNRRPWAPARYTKLKSIWFTLAVWQETKSLIRELISSLPIDPEKLKFRRASRLVLMPGCEVSPQFRTGAAAALRLGIDSFNGTEKPEQICTILNQKIETDSEGAIRDTFDEDDLSGGVIAVLMTTLYFRARWRAAPTVLNGTWPFHDADDAPKRTVRMIKVNDIMGYADIKEWNAQALEITYASPDLSLLIIVPRVTSLRKLADYVTGTSIKDITSRMRKTRVAATLPLYTLRMTLLLPNKLQAMGISQLFDVSNWKKGNPLRLSHMVQRLMFWAEAGRNAYKDDGLEWDAAPEMQILIDRPYIFFVRWRNLTLMNGNFVL